MNQAFSNHFFPHTNALGAQVGTSEQGRVAGPDYVIAGVVSNAKYRSLREPIIPIMYILTNEFSSVVLSVRAHGQPAATIGPIRGIFSAIDSSLPLLEISTLEEDIEASTAGERITMVLASTFGGLEMLMTALGIYGLMAYVVTETKWELGLRMALGAPPRVIAMLLGRQAFPMVLSGVVLGVIAGLMCTPLMRSVLYGVSPSDWRSFISAVLFVLMVVTAGLAVPLARAVTIRPAEALRTRQ